MQDRVHDELGKTRLARDRTDVQSIIDFITENCEKPFDMDSVPSELVNIAVDRLPQNQLSSP